ncbi:peptide deformylase [Spartinivicinus poritis]|uniref:Peptide deformylase n=1 Tax=Spartinivicinus poritis TaxID=2994640 RepID=A0ABT5UI40_9GAMM|nr:peptide deformylase [Spartinivicinus sp. A2-2]MDE1465192.1 peptide deformylase [Spartinivicinus sp. A2-2]
MKVSSQSLAIRQVGDPILHQSLKPADLSNLSAISAMISIMKESLNGGVGVACNQCSAIKQPVQIMIIGTDDEQLRQQAMERYPGETIPHITVMLNPKMTSVSQETYFPISGEGCLSVFGPIRGKVKRHRSVTVEYWDEQGNQHLETCEGFFAHIIQHEMDHLQGVTFVERIFADCTTEQCQQLLSYIDQELIRREQLGLNITEIEVGPAPLVFERNDNGGVIFEPKHFQEALTELMTPTVVGLHKVLNNFC